MKVSPVLRTAADWVIPPSVERLLRRSAERLFDHSMAPNRALHNRHAGERRCFVIGNGPSLKGMNLKPLANEFTISANSFYKHPDAVALGLKYLCIGDPHFMTDEPRSIEWHRIIESVMPKTSLLLNKLARPLVEKHGLYRQQERFYVSTSSILATRPNEINLDLTRPLNAGQSTGTLIMIPLAMYLGFREIYLLGFDANWLESRERSYHFYETHDQYPEFDSIAADSRNHSYEEDVESVRREFEGHRLLNACAQKLGVRMWNATAGGRVDTYPRIRLDDVLRSRA